MKGDLRVMWLLIFFDLPVTEAHERRAAGRFRKFLLNDGYIMLQFSIYARVCYTNEAVDKHLKRAQENTPAVGSIRALTVTDKQYSRMRIILGNIKMEEKYGAQQLLFL